MGKVALKLNGQKPLDLNPKSPRIAGFKAFLDGAPIDDVFTQEWLVKNGKLSGSYFGQAKDTLPDHTFLVGRLRYWGNPKAIKALREQTA